LTGQKSPAALLPDISFVAGGKRRGSMRICLDHLSSRALRGGLGAWAFAACAAGIKVN
jgi:hypothetical protein